MANLRDTRINGTINTGDIESDGKIYPGAIASGLGSVAFGGLRYDCFNPDVDNYGRTLTSAEGNQAFAAGGSVHAYGDWSVALGKDTKAYQRASFASGGGTKAGRTYEEWLEFKGLEASDANLVSYKKEHHFAFAQGEVTYAIGRASHAEGKQTTASEEASHSSGYSTRAEGYASHSEGENTIASNRASHAEGYDTEASGKYSHSEGENTIASAYVSHSEGHTTYAEGYASHSEGKDSKASGPYSHAEGYGALAKGSSSHAEGVFAEANAEGSHAEGKGTIANQPFQHVSGSYNKNKEDTLLEVGNGTNGKARSNAFEVYKDGRAKVYTKPKEDEDVVRKFELSELDLNLVSGNGFIKSIEQIDGKVTATTSDTAEVLKVIKAPEEDTDVVRMLELDTKINRSKMDANFFNSLY